MKSSESPIPPKNITKPKNNKSNDSIIVKDK
jgi:hypothetical protein